ncbi:Gfo/Idh/MocA family protein [Streptomyces sp. NPDC047853]|uniref:Gfo/Idh/MocA family protein n=1 Tax=unclassified Streptomyces TaxID=2593676 RepID=UPI003455FB8F
MTALGTSAEPFAAPGPPRPEASPVLRFGAIGCGDIAGRRTLPALLSTPGTVLTCVGSRDPERAKALGKHFDCEAVAPYEALLERPDVDAVYIAVPSMLHAEWAAAALRAGKHVLVEKPAAANHADAHRLFAMARERGLVLMENFMFLHHSQHATVKALLEAGTIGELRTFSAAFTIPPRADDDMRYRPDIGGGALLDNGVYPLRAALHFLGPDLRLTGAVLRRDRRRGVVVSGSVLLAAPQGVAAHLAFGMEHGYRSAYELHGSTGSLALSHVFTTPDSHHPVLRLSRQDHREERVLPVDRHFVNILSVFRRAVIRAEDVSAESYAALRQAGLVDEIVARAETFTV